MKYWPRAIKDLEQSALEILLEKRRALIRQLSPDLEIKASQLFTLAEQDPAIARLRLYHFLVNRLEQVPLVSATDQQQIEVLLQSLLPENFNIQNECEKCLTNCNCKT